MANPEHLAILKQGVDEWNNWTKQWWEENQFAYPRDFCGDFSGADLASMDLTGVSLTRANLKMANLADTNLARACLIQANLNGAYLRGADFCEAVLVAAELREATPVGANFRSTWSSGVDLTGTILTKADLSDADFRKAKFRQADLSMASLSATDLREADLTAASLNGALISGTLFGGANLSDTEFSDVEATSTSFDDVDLSVAKGLEAVRHGGPSTIGIDTIYKSHGKIPEVFLRGCGVPDEFIAYIGSIVGRPIEFYSCFISYSTKDQEFADRLYADLQNKGVRCWFAPYDVKGGRKLHEQLDEAIRVHDKLLLLLSDHSMNSDWVGTEISKAREREHREGKQMLFPITLVPFEEVKEWKLFDADRGKDSAREVREYFIPDFSNWKDHDSYQKAFQRLVQDLKARARE